VLVDCHDEAWGVAGSILPSAKTVACGIQRSVSGRGAMYFLNAELGTLRSNAKRLQCRTGLLVRGDVAAGADR